MRSSALVELGRGTDLELIETVRWRARFEVARGLGRGEEPGEVRDAVIRRFRKDIGVESFGDYADEALMAALQRGIDDALTERD